MKCALRPVNFIGLSRFSITKLVVVSCILSERLHQDFCKTVFDKKYPRSLSGISSTGSTISRTNLDILIKGTEKGDTSISRSAEDFPMDNFLCLSYEHQA
jgi:hypothetical protein